MKQRLPVSHSLAILVSVTVGGWLAWAASANATAHPDFAMFWAAVQGRNPYDLAALRAHLGWGAYPVAFVYPPSAIPVFALFGMLPFRFSLTAWSALSAGAMAAASRSKWSPLLLFTPAVLWALPGGQLSVLLGALLLTCLTMAERPKVAGLLLGIALALKPQFAVIVLLALLIDQRLLVVGVAVAAFLTLSAASAVWFGFLWPDWLNSLPSFLAQQASAGTLHRNEIAPDLPPIRRIAAGIAGLGFAVIAIRMKDYVAAFVASVGAALICSPHAMGYEFAMFTPAIPALLKRRDLASVATVIFIATPALIWAGVPSWPWRLASLGLLVLATLARQERETDHSPARLARRRRFRRDRACG